MEKQIRVARETDLARILAIYRPYVEETAVSSEYEVPTADAFRQRYQKVIAQYPWLVAEIEGTIAGYTYCSRIFERAAYQWDAYISIYLDEAYQGQGIARALSKTALAIMEALGYRHIYAVIVGDNVRSARFHRALGFQPAATFVDASFKCGAWHDAVWYHRQINPCDQPLPPTPFSQLNEEALTPFLSAYLDDIKLP